MKLGAFLPPLCWAVLVAGSGCATVPPCPGRGGPAWRELTSEHFVVRSDLELDEVIEVVKTLEENRTAMLAWWGGRPGPVERTPVIALSRRELGAFDGFAYDGYYVRRPPFPGTVIAAGHALTRNEIVKHELAHDLAFHFEPIEPRWYAEGVATFLETTRYDRETRQASLGEPSETRLAFFQVRGRVRGPSPIEELLGPPPTDLFELSRFYGTSWLLTHYLVNQRPQAYQRFKRRINALEPGSAAFRAEFPDLDSDGLYTVLTSYLSSGNYTVIRGTLPPWGGTPGVRSMADPEVHALRAFLYSAVHISDESQDLAAMRAEVDEALVAASPPIEALAVAFYTPELKYRIGRRELATMAVKAHPENWMAWIMLADASPKQEEPPGGEVLLRARGLAPDEPEVLVRLAEKRAAQGKWNVALALSGAALPAGANHPDIWLIYAAALWRTGQCDQARRWVAAIKGYLPAASRHPLEEATAGTCIPEGQPGSRSLLDPQNK